MVKLLVPWSASGMARGTRIELWVDMMVIVIDGSCVFCLRLLVSEQNYMRATSLLYLYHELAPKYGTCRGRFDWLYCRQQTGTGQHPPHVLKRPILAFHTAANRGIPSPHGRELVWRRSDANRCIY